MVHDDIVYMRRMTSGLRRVDVIYRRVTMTFSIRWRFVRIPILGVAGLFNAYRSGMCLSPTRSGQAWPMTRPFMPTFRHHPYYLARSLRRRRRDLFLPTIRTIAQYASKTSTSWWSRRWVSPAATAC